MGKNKVSFKVIDKFRKQEYDILISNGYLYINGFSTFLKVKTTDKISIFNSEISVNNEYSNLIAREDGIFREGYGNIEIPNFPDDFKQ